MIFGSILSIATSALWANKLRSGLTLLGVIVGVTSVMTIISALEGVQQSMEEDLNRLGPATFIVQRMGIVMSEEQFWEKVKRKPLTMRSIALLERGCTLCDKISPRRYISGNVKYGSQTLRDLTVAGGTANYIDIVDLEPAYGRFFTSDDDLARRSVAYIGEDVRKEFFEGVDPIGKQIVLDGSKYNVIGVAQEMGAMFGESQDDFVVIPFSRFQGQYGAQTRGLNIVIKAKSVEQLPAAMDQVRAILRAQRHVPPDKDDDFDMLTADNILDALNDFTAIARATLIGISSISLVVGGIVVMNIMMVSVTERTREIGIRKALGAKQKHILLQFVFESLLMTLGGGLIGVLLGFLIAKVLVAQIDMNVAPSMLAISAGLFISTGVGLIFGIYPAMKAARLDPVRALSYE